MGFVLGGLVSGLGKGISEGYDAYRQQKQLDATNAIAKIRAAVDQKKAESEVNYQTAEAEKLRHQNQSPVFGESGYNEAKGAEAAAIEQGKLPTEIQKMVQQGLITQETGARLAGITHGYKSQELAQEGGIKSGLLGQEYGMKGGLMGQEYGLKSGLQKQQQGYETGKLTQELQGQLANRIQGIGATQSGQIVPTLVHGVKSFFGVDQPPAPPASVAPSSSLTPEQQARAQTDPAYAAFLRIKGQL